MTQSEYHKDGIISGARSGKGVPFPVDCGVWGAWWAPQGSPGRTLTRNAFLTFLGHKTLLADRKCDFCPL